MNPSSGVVPDVAVPDGVPAGCVAAGGFGGGAGVWAWAPAAHVTAIKNHPRGEIKDVST
jgi:hypothetical protein